MAGVALAIASLIAMLILAAAKRRLGMRLDSAATRGEGGQNLLYAYLAAAVLFGLLGNTLLGPWWLDPTIGLLIAALALREGRKDWKGETMTADGADTDAHTGRTIGLPPEPPR